MCDVIRCKSMSSGRNGGRGTMCMIIKERTYGHIMQKDAFNRIQRWALL